MFLRLLGEMIQIQTWLHDFQMGDSSNNSNKKWETISTLHLEYPQKPTVDGSEIRRANQLRGR